MIRDTGLEKRSNFSIESAQRLYLGFTLIEVLVSASVIILLLLSLAQLTVHSLLIKRISEYRINSAVLASSKLEYFKSLPFESEELAEGSGEETIEKQGLKGLYRRQWSIQDVSPEMKEIEIECFYAHSPERKIRLVFYMFKKLGF